MKMYVAVNASGRFHIANQTHNIVDPDHIALGPPAVRIIGRTTRFAITALASGDTEFQKLAASAGLTTPVRLEVQFTKGRTIGLKFLSGRPGGPAAGRLAKKLRSLLEKVIPSRLGGHIVIELAIR